MCRVLYDIGVGIMYEYLYSGILIYGSHGCMMDITEIIYLLEAKRQCLVNVRDGNV